MTAIFATWNKWGFSLAADSNLTTQSDGQAWVDPVEKIMKIQDHQVAFAASGMAMIEGVEINELIREWSKKLTKIPFGTLREYVEDFLIFYSKQEFYKKESLPEWSFQVIRDELSFLKSLLDQGIQDSKELELRFFEERSSVFESLNIFASHFNAMNEYEKVEEHSFWDEWKINEFRKIHKRVKSENANFSIVKQNSFQYKNAEWLREIFRDVIGTEFDIEDDLHLSLIELSTVQLESKLWNPQEKVRTLFIGFGQNDWEPQAIELDLYNLGCGIPSAAIKYLGRPSDSWFLSLAIDNGVFGFLKGFGGAKGRLEEVITAIKPYIKRGKVEDFSSALANYGDSLLTAGMGKMDSLTPARLEYVARLFVQLESLYSYLNEPVPRVGGDVATITMTKTTFKAHKAPELLIAD